MKTIQLERLDDFCLLLGFLSILGSFAAWFFTGGRAQQTAAHAERFGIFVGLWVPSFLILSNRLARYVEKPV